MGPKRARTLSDGGHRARADRRQERTPEPAAPRSSQAIPPMKSLCLSEPVVVRKRLRAVSAFTPVTTLFEVADTEVRQDESD